MVGGSGNIATDDEGGPSQPVQALVVAVPTTGDATEDPLHIRAAVKVVANSGPTGPGPAAPPAVEPLQDFRDIGAAVNTIAVSDRSSLEI